MIKGEGPKFGQLNKDIGNLEEFIDMFSIK